MLKKCCILRHNKRTHLQRCALLLKFRKSSKKGFGVFVLYFVLSRSIMTIIPECLWISLILKSVTDCPELSCILRKIQPFVLECPWMFFFILYFNKISFLPVSSRFFWSCSVLKRQNLNLVFKILWSGKKNSSKQTWEDLLSNILSSNITLIFLLLISYRSISHGKK